ncbi:unnamed protein product [Dovyalis caffra]|uniref:Uncharacterized protein n=1 Tax=Dovyalis caffra TaxID=77055 RepID=A0AAV1RG75_9ROSI|nr:unnamed protein product [Dovyalis caffra]
MKEWFQSGHIVVEMAARISEGKLRRGWPNWEGCSDEERFRGLDCGVMGGGLAGTARAVGFWKGVVGARVAMAEMYNRSVLGEGK